MHSNARVGQAEHTPLGQAGSIQLVYLPSRSTPTAMVVPGAEGWQSKSLQGVLRARLPTH